MSKTWTLLATTLMAVAVSAFHAAAAEVKPPAGFRPLFNAKNFDGWFGMKHFDPRKYWAMTDAERQEFRDRNHAETFAHWTIDGNEVVNDGKGPYLTTLEEFGDYELLIDYKTVAKADSGIYLKATPQVQIWDFTKAGGKWKIGADKGSGGLWNNSAGSAGKDPLVLADKPFGQWNAFRIVQVGSRTTIHLNGKLVVNHARMHNYWDRKSPLFPQGPIQLQTHGGEIRWRNIFIREIPADEANRILAKSGDKGFQSAFNGKDFTGWKGPVGNYEVVDGTLKCKARKGGTIYTEQEYADFAVRFEFNLPPGGNNGLAIRYPGGGDTAYVGMCELQVLDNTAQKYARLDKRQYHGSAYGMVPAHRGFLRDTGQWNFQEVTGRGSTIQVELNGTVILDADLAQVKEFMGKRPHPGKDRQRGHFGFAGHNDPVQFRNIAIKALETKRVSSK